MTPDPVQTDINELGRRLTEARVERGWNVQDVARELRLSPFQVTALEGGMYDELPGDTYVRGYLRSYARLLGLSVDQMLALHSQAVPAVAGADNAVAPRVRREARSSDRLMMLVSGLLVIAVVVMLVLWWQGRDNGFSLGGAPAGQTAPVASGNQATGSAGTVLSAVPEEQQQTSAASGKVAPSPDSGGPAVASGEAAFQPDERMAALDPDRPSAADGEKALQPTVADGADTAATPATRPAGVEAGPDGARKTDSMAAAGVAEQDPPSAVPAPGETRLVLRFNADCWTDIRDRAGKRLIYRTVLSGQTLVVDGAAPLRVFFGYAPGVEMTVDGEPLDFSAHVRGGVFARFDIAGAN